MAPSAKAAGPECVNINDGDTTTGADTCVLDDTSPQINVVDALNDADPDTEANDILRLDGDPNAFTFDMTTLGTTYLNFETLDIAGGDVTLSGDGSFTGSVTVSAGTAIVDHAGAIDNAELVTVAEDATLEGNVNYTVKNLTNHGFVRGLSSVTGNVANDGTMAIGLSDGDISTLNITGNYGTATGDGIGEVIFDVDLSLAASPGVNSDLIVSGGNASGSTYIDINELNLPNTGLATTGNGILLWQIGGTGGAFALEHGVFSGEYQYLLRYVNNYSGTNDGLFLVSVAREELYGQVALLSAGHAAIRECFRSDQRIPDSPKTRGNVRMWFDGGNGSMESGADTGIDMDQDTTCATGGMDFGGIDGLRIGVVGGYGTTTADYSIEAGQGQLEGDTAAVEGLLSIGSPSYFFNVTAGYATTDWTVDGPTQAALGATQSGIIGSAQAGTTIDLTPFRFKLIAAVNYDDTTCGSDCLLPGTVEDTGLWEAKGTIRIEAMTREIHPYVAVSYSDDMSGGSSVTLGNAHVAADTANSLLALNAGFKAPLDDGFVIYGDLAIIDGMDTDITGMSLHGGIKLYW